MVETQAMKSILYRLFQYVILGGNMWYFPSTLADTFLSTRTKESRLRNYKEN
jgi:hypothetical protein